MSFSFTTLAVLLVLAAVQLAAGMILGRCLFVGRPRSDDHIRHDAGRIREFAGRLFALAAGMAEDVGRHQSEIRQASEELAAVKPDENDDVTGFVLKTVAQIVKTNERLQTRLSAAEEKLQEQTQQIETQFTEARTDPLTGLANRRAFDDALIRRIAEWHRKKHVFCLMMIDIDHFKQLNDTHGHPAGDQVLRELAAVLQDTTRKMDLIGRLGGEEFAVILPSTTAENGQRATERTRQAVAAETICFEGEDLRLTVSLGLATTTAEDDADTLLKRADEALYAAKHAGRNRAYFHNGKYCEPIATTTPATPEQTPPASGDDSADTEAPEELELAAACEDLRDRLAEVARRPEPSQPDADPRR